MNLNPMISTQQSLFQYYPKLTDQAFSARILFKMLMNSPKRRSPKFTEIWNSSVNDLLINPHWHRAKYFLQFLPVNPCHVKPQNASKIFCLYKTLLVSSSRVYLESVWAGPSSCRNDVLLCPQIVHNWRTELLCPKISALGGREPAVDVSTTSATR